MPIIDTNLGELKKAASAGGSSRQDATDMTQVAGLPVVAVENDTPPPQAPEHNLLPDADRHQPSRGADNKTPSQNESAGGTESAKIAPKQEDMRQAMTSEVSAASQSTQTPNWFLQPDPAQYVIFPPRPGNKIYPLESGKECFGAIAEAIMAAKKSIDLISWGLDTDLRLIRSEGANDFQFIDRDNRPIGGLCPYVAGSDSKCVVTHDETACPYKDKGGEQAALASFRLSDLLTCAAHRGVSVRVLIWAPVVMADTIIDPVHYWFRSKIGAIPNTQFMFRYFKGTFPQAKPAERPSVQSVKKIPKEERPKLLMDQQSGLQEGDRRTDQELKTNTTLYELAYSHHQKMALIDGDDPKTGNPVGFIIGTNFQESYWDTSQHETWSTFRVPAIYGGDTRFNLRPWRDAGVMLKGPVLADLAANMQQGWETSWEHIPKTFILAGLMDIGSILDENTMNQLQATNPQFLSGLQKLDFKNLKQLNHNLSNLPPFPRIEATTTWQKKKNIQSGDWLPLLTNFLIELERTLSLITAEGLKALQGLIPKASGWPGSIPPPDAFKLDNSPDAQTVQFLRTFSLQNKPIDLSIQKAYKKIVEHVKNDNGFIYIENQYFRDILFAEAVAKLSSTYQAVTPKGVGKNLAPRNPYLVIVTNRNTNEDGVGIGEHPELAATPTALAYARMKECGVKCDFFWLRILDIPKVYDKPRSNNMFSDIILNLLFDQFEKGTDLSQLRQNTLQSVLRLLPNVAPTYWEQYQSLISSTWIIGGHQAENLEIFLGRIDQFLQWLYTHKSGQAMPLSTEQQQEGYDLLAKGVEQLGEGVVVPQNMPPLPEIKAVPYSERRDPGTAIAGTPDGAIYVHTKIMTVDACTAIVGSANLNERSQWHDTENAVLFRSTEREDAADALRKKLLSNVLKSHLPNEWDGKRIFQVFQDQATKNEKARQAKQTLESHVLKFVPHAVSGGSSVLS